MILKSLPAQKFEGEAPVTAKRMQEYHEQNILEQTTTAKNAERALRVDLGELGTDFQLGTLDTYEGRTVTYTKNGEIYSGHVIDGELWGSPFTREA